MNIATHAQHVLGLHLEIVDGAGLRLREIEGIARVVANAVDIVKEVVAVANLKYLPDSHPEHSRMVETVPLIDHDGILGYSRRRKLSFQANESIRETSVDSRHHSFLNNLLAFVEVIALRIDAHPNHSVAGQFSHKADVAFDRAGTGLCR
jgi:hypothetical protein